jgi:lysophospholipase L1-like esterase
VNLKRPFSWKQLLLKLGFSCLVFILAMGVFEIALRLQGYGNLEIYAPDPRLFWRLKPNQNCYTKVDHKPVHINSHGTRGPEFETAKPPGTFRILSLGDSRTFGWGLTENETYSAKLGQMLQDSRGMSNRVEVINAGVNGWSYQQMLVYFREDGLAMHPDAVLIGEANLWTQFSEHSTPEFVRKFIWRVRLKNLLRRSAIYHYAIELKLKDFYERHRAKFIPIDPNQDPFFKEQQQKDPNAVFRTAIHDLCSLARSNGVQPMLLFLPVLGDLQNTNASDVLQIKRSVSESLDVPLIDMTELLQPGGGRCLYLEGDPVHFNVDGNRIIAETIYRRWPDIGRHQK